MKRSIIAFVVLGVCCTFGTVAAPADTASRASVGDEYDPMVCGPLANAFGPFDYRTSPPDRRRLVESFHYDIAMEAIHRGESKSSTNTIWGDLDYTLRAFPNHPLALQAIDRLAWEVKSDRVSSRLKSAKCYFLRAVAFQPDDGSVRLLFGLYLLRRGDTAQAIAQLESAQSLSPDDRNVQYNLGLAYVQLKDYARALASAHKAYALGFPLPGLRNMLKRAGKWQDDPSSTVIPSPAGK